MRDSFYGWYMKCQSDTQTLAVIPAIHQAGRKATCSIQIITDDGVWEASFPSQAFHQANEKIYIGKNRFARDGICLNIKTPKLTVKGKLSFGSLSPLKYDIMGPFALVPFMECRHSVWSMRHSVCGTVSINEQNYSFQNGIGYWEGDRGCSFPKAYAWTQCFFPDGSLMLSVADIPIAGIHFTGIIGIVLWQSHEYRLATYLGAKAVKIENGILRIVQGNMELEARLLKSAGRPLMAPVNGNMTRTIHESASCQAFYRFKKNGTTLFAFKTGFASFEYEYPL